MTFGELKSLFRDLLNRSDCSDAQTVRFLKLAVGRLQRELRIPAMERAAATTAEVATDFVHIPSDFLELIDVLVDGRPLQRVTYRHLARIPRDGSASAFARVGDAWELRPCVPQGTPVMVLYYGEFGDMTADGDENEIAAIAPDLVVYGALSFAGDFYEHDKRAEWEARYQALLAELQRQAAAQEAAGGAPTIQPAYGGHEV